VTKPEPNSINPIVRSQREYY